MMHYKPYTLEPLDKQKKIRRYRYEELARMTTMQLMDICEREELINATAITDRLDSQRLRHLIMQFRGSRTPHLILDEVAGGQERLANALKRMTLHEVKHKDDKETRGAKQQTHDIEISGKIVAFDGLDTNIFDKFAVTFKSSAMQYTSELDGVNAIIVDKSNDICAIFQVNSYAGKDGLFLTRSGKMPCREANIRGYRLLLFRQKLSNLVYQVYNGEIEKLPPEDWVYSVELREFHVVKPIDIDAPLMIDFGTTNTTAGFYMDNSIHEKIKKWVQEGQVFPSEINYVRHITPDGEIVPVLPTAIGVEQIQDGKIIYSFGHEAEKMILDSYIDDEFCVFYDIKRWINDYEREEELSDHIGHRIHVPRKEIIRKYLQFIIESANQRFKCNFKNVSFSYPVKQRSMFMSLYHDVMAENINVQDEDTLDEGVAALYGYIRAMANDPEKYEEDFEYNALILDCGGGTTDLSTCKFTITNERESHKNIDMKTTYNHGDTDFGGNKLTYRIMQLLKIAVAHELTNEGVSLKDITNKMNVNIYHEKKDKGIADGYYSVIDEAYALAEQIIPTRFYDYEYRSTSEYYRVRNNMYFLFTLAEQVKKEFFSNPQILQVLIGDTESEKDRLFMQFLQSEHCALVDTPRWKFTARVNNSEYLSEQKIFPLVTISTMLIKKVLHGDIYDILHQFLYGLYDTDAINDYHIIHLTGQSCKVDIFRDSLKEFLPGIKSRGQQNNDQSDYRLKLCCLNGAIWYRHDKKTEGHINVTLTYEKPSLPYTLKALTHTGTEKILLEALNNQRLSGSVSRFIESMELRLFLLNTQGEKKYEYTVHCDPNTFTPIDYEGIERRHGEFIPQYDVDIIENEEVCYFVWVDDSIWGFTVVPVSRQNDQLYIGLPQEFMFENENWLINYFNGKW